MSSTTEVPVQFWDEVQDSDEGFWVTDAMKSAVSLHWYRNYRQTPRVSMPNITVTLDRDRGVVIVQEVMTRP